MTRAFAIPTMVVLAVFIVLVALWPWPWYACGKPEVCKSTASIILKCIGVTGAAWSIAFLMPLALQGEPKRRLRDEAGKRAGDALAEKLRQAQNQLDDAARKSTSATAAAEEADTEALKKGVTPEKVALEPAVIEAQKQLKATQADFAAKSKDVANAQKSLDNAKDFSDLWVKLSQPEYAIGLGLITKDDYSYLVTTDQTQSTVIAGMALPLLFLVMMVLIRLPATSSNAVIDAAYIVLAGIEVLLVVAAADRKHKFEKSSQAMIAGAYAKNQSDKKKAAGDGTSKVSDQITTALKAATILQSTDLKIIPADAPDPS